MGAFGVCVVNDDAFAAGVASIPGPFTDAASDLWFVHQFLYVRTEFHSAIGIQEIGHELTWEIDSKAMRKVAPEQTIAFVIENGHASFGAIGLANLRILTTLASR